MNTSRSPAKRAAARTTGAQRPPKKANWSAWRHSAMLPLRDAVALSLGLEPASVSLEHRDFALRLKLAVAHFRARRLLRVNMQERAAQPALSLVWVPHFAAWARQRPKWSLPPEMAAIAQARLSASDGGSDAAQRRALRARNWQEAMRAMADELHQRDLAAGEWCSLTEMARRLALEAARHNIHGARGELSEGNILRAALSGGQWQRPATARQARAAKKAKTPNQERRPARPAGATTRAKPRN
ncbi:MAG TPA: hypothetical protein VGN52_11175 [Burkholderiales bacterium]|jgi:hypothetical protein